MSDIINLKERGGDPAIKMARLIMESKADPLCENTREEWLASSLLAAHDNIKCLTAERESEREARERLVAALASKDEAMGVLFKRLQESGVDCSDLMS